MEVPAAENIEAAVGQISKLEKWLQTDQQKELSSAMGDNELNQLGATVPISNDFRRGYELGLQTARIITQSGGNL